MEIRIFGAIVGFIAGLVGFVIVKLWMGPILDYRKEKKKLNRDLDALLDSNLNQADELLQRMKKYAVKLPEMHNLYLPPWYRIQLAARGESPVDAAPHLSTLSNTKDMDHISKRIAQIKETLKLK